MEPNGKSQRDAANQEAASWVVRLAHGDVDQAEQARFEAWLSVSPFHELAFERESLAWERTERLRAMRPADGPIDDLLLSRGPNRRAGARRPVSSSWRMAAAAVLCIAVGGAGFLWVGEGSRAYATAVGERRVVVLEDGSRVELNTDTRLSVRLTPTGRRVKLIRGEALFDVRHDRRRPFTVTADTEEVKAVGTSFTVRLDRSDVKVLVVNGEVEVSGRAGPEGRRFMARLPAGSVGIYGEDGAVNRAIGAGERDRALSWRYGAIALSGETLREAAAEFNRYNTKQLVVGAGAVGDLRLGGYFQQSDVEGFARALQSSFGVKIADTGSAIYLTGSAASQKGASRAPAIGSAAPAS